MIIIIIIIIIITIIGHCPLGLVIAVVTRDMIVITIVIVDNNDYHQLHDQMNCNCRIITIIKFETFKNCIVFKYLYSAPQQPWANRGAFGSISSKKRDKF